MKNLLATSLFFLTLPILHAQSPHHRPSDPSLNRSAAPRIFHDRASHINLPVPNGWLLNTHDYEVSAFRSEVHTVPPSARIRAVLSASFNPYPLSTFAGAYLYLSVAPNVTEATCTQQAPNPTDTLEIDHQPFLHAHTEQANRVCVESRDDIYTAFHRHGCYRFDLVVNTFCRQFSGAQEITPNQLKELHARMESILTAVQLQ